MSIVLARSRFPTLLIVFVGGAWLTRSAEPLTSSPRVEVSVGPRQTAPANNRPLEQRQRRLSAPRATNGRPPDTLPRDRWRDEIARMFLIQNNQAEPSGPPGTAGRMVKLPLDWQSIVGYYEANAPERLDLLAPLRTWPAPDRASSFRKRVVSTGKKKVFTRHQRKAVDEEDMNDDEAQRAMGD